MVHHCAQPVVVAGFAVARHRVRRACQRPLDDLGRGRDVQVPYR